MDRKRIDELIRIDRELIWHPYAAAPATVDPYPVESASGTKLMLADGREVIDGMSSWWAAVHGYNHPVLNAAVTEQLGKMAHVMFGGLTHQPAVELARKLAEITPGDLSRVFFCDSGSVAVEVAIKIAFQYWLSLGRPEKNRLLTIRGGYHGDTFGAMSVCDPVSGMHAMFGDRLMAQYFADIFPPVDADRLADMRSILETESHKIAAVIIEPVVQGAGGMRFYPPELVAGIRRLCNEFGVLLIADEIATGFGRTGRMFACDHANVTPDILCLGKAMTGGYLSFAATITRQEISQVISSCGLQMLMHGPTYMANPLACSLALASIRLLETYDLSKIINNIERLFWSGLEKCRELPGVKDVRVMGAIGVVETHERVDVARVQQRAIEKGVWLRPFGNLVYTMPPFIIRDDELAVIAEAIYFALKD
ncbi:MAG: adenosylmethionine--8-amino-7-oxononanoate transaminase [Proteobacteria bacterium]|nr:adenosylmethionine--8-amino-7-oxononanoate transaminase [Pseudomonadota bacterium]MBU1737015.1 adenosylmethionine--8-amino-7-oxononanoate transaminase [Pseudomonadota bacterium]